jgi:hypothetical protein
MKAFDVHVHLKLVEIKQEQTCPLHSKAPHICQQKKGRRIIREMNLWNKLFNSQGLENFAKPSRMICHYPQTSTNQSFALLMNQLNNLWTRIKIICTIFGELPKL